MKRQRGRSRRSGGGGNNNNPNRHYESNGPDVKIRGSAQQILEKYQQYARDAISAGDRVNGENYQQHAEHYYRLIAAMQPKDRPRDDQRQSSNNDDDDDDNDGEDTVSEARNDDQGDDDRNENGRDNGQRRGNNDSRRRRGPREDRASGQDDPSGQNGHDGAGEPSGDRAEAVAERRPRRAPRPPANEPVIAADGDDGVMKTLSRGRPVTAEAAQADGSAPEIAE